MNARSCNRSCWAALVLSVPIGLGLCRDRASAQEIPSLAGWQILLRSPGTHRGCVDLSQAHSGKGSGKICPPVPIPLA